MSQIKSVFKRYEKKYLLNEKQYTAFTQFLENKMVSDQYGKYTISNIYYDTLNYQLIRASIAKPVYKEKLRLRSYGVPSENETVFVELKKKYNKVVYKRRVPMKLKDAKLYLDQGKLNRSCQILNEINWFLNFYHPIPQIYIAYDRIAMSGKENPDLRITFDTNIRWRQSMLDLSKGSWGTHLLKEDEHLMEIKIPGAIPVWLSKGLDALNIFPTSYSKYGTCYKNFLVKTMKGGACCA